MYAGYGGQTERIEKLPPCVTKYERNFKTRDDPIIHVLEPMELALWLNISNAQRSDKYKDKCPLCGETDNAQHAFCDCKKLGHLSSALAKSFDTKMVYIQGKLQ